jgi:ubiquitin C-terminal hydrolase
MGIDRSYFGRLKVMLENLVKSDQQKSRDLVQFCLDHLRFSDQLVDTPLLGLFNFGIGVQI